MHRQHRSDPVTHFPHRAGPLYRRRVTATSAVVAARRRAAARSGGPVAGTGLAVASVASVQFGAALASTLFPIVGPVGTVSLRLTVAALVLAVTNRIWRVRWQWAELKLVLLFGAVLA